MRSWTNLPFQEHRVAENERKAKCMQKLTTYAEEAANYWVDIAKDAMDYAGSAMLQPQMR
jgi:hypothetical protein